MHFLRLLGGAALHGPDGELVTGAAGHPRRIAVLALLAEAYPRAVTRDKVVGILWPDRPPRKARRLLTQALYELRKEVGKEAITTSGNDLRLDSSVLEVDLIEFRRALDEGDLEEAARLYTGPALDGFFVDRSADFQQWADHVRDEIARAYRVAAERLAERAREEGRAAEEARWMRRVVKEKPYDASAVRGLMKALERAGNRSDALLEAERYRERMRDDLDLDPHPDIEELARRIREEPRPVEMADEAGDASGGDARDAPRSDQPAPGPSLVDSDVGGMLPDPPIPAAGDSGEATSKPALRVVGSVAVALAAGVLAFVGLSDGSPPDTGGRDASLRSLAVLPFAMTGAEGAATTDPDATLHSLVTVQLNGLPGLRARLVGDSIDGLPEEAGSESWGILRGKGVRTDGEIRVEAALRVGDDAGTARVVSVRGPADSLGVVADRLVIRLVERLHPEVVSTLNSLPSFRSTNSPRALMAFLEGERAFRRGAFDEAHTAFEQSVRQDPNYVVALYRLAVVTEWTHRIGEANRAIEQALALADRLSPRERLLVQAYAAWRIGDARAAEEIYREILGGDHESLEGWFHLAEIGYHAGPLLGRPVDRAADAWRQVVALDSANFPALTHLVRLEARAGNEAALGRLVDQLADYTGPGPVPVEGRVIAAYGLEDPRRIRRVQDEIDELPPYSQYFLHAMVAGFLEDPEGARPIALRMIEESRPDAVRAQGYIALAHLAVAAGRWQRAWEQLDHAAELSPVFAAWSRAYLATLPFVTVPPEAVAEAERSLAQVPISPTTAPLYIEMAVEDPAAPVLGAYLRVLLASRSTRGSDAGAPGLAGDEADPGVELPCPAASDAAAVVLCRDLERGLRAERALELGDESTALAILESMTMRVPYTFAGRSAFYARSRERFLRAELLFRAGRYREAHDWFAAVPHGARYDYVYLAPTHLRRGQIRERLGELDAAERHYRKVLELWSDPDAGLSGIRDQAERGLERVVEGEGDGRN